jgi:hypothetical protein
VSVVRLTWSFCALAALATGQDLAIARAAARIDTAIPWMTDGFQPADPGAPVPKLPKTGVDRLDLLDQALERATREKKLVFWYVPRIEGGHMVRPEFLDTYMRAVAFTDGWLTALVNARFVPLRMAVDGPVAKRTGITKLDWVEPAIVILDGHGRILHRLDRIRTFDATFLRGVLTKALDDGPGVPPETLALVERAIENPGRHAEAAATAALAAGFDSGAERIARELVSRGAADPAEPGAASPLGAPACTPPERGREYGHLLEAIVCRLRGDADGLEKALAANRTGSHPDAGLNGAFATESALLHLHRGDLARAEAAFEFASALLHPRRSEAMYLLAITQVLRGKSAEAEQTFREVVAEFGPDDPHAARAAVNLLRGRDTTPVGPAFHGFEDPVWPRRVGMAESRTTTARPRPAQDAHGAARDAVAFLLRRQGENGGFEDSRYAYCDSPRILPNVWVAITAVALAGLDDWRELDPEAIDAAIARGEHYLFDEASLARGRNEECYADAFRLVYLTRRLPRLPAGSDAAARARRLMNEVAKRLPDQQNGKGFFAHEYPNPFATAAVLLGLKAAEDAGAAVPGSVLEKGVRAIASTRGEAGTFAYGGRKPGAEPEAAFRNAMARMPACERALMLSGAGRDTGALEAALDNFWRWLPRFERIRTCDFHSDGELGGFFFWHGVFLTSEAIKALPADKRGAHERRMLEHVTSIGEVDGSFVDSHEVGKSYGTGMALMVLRNSAGKGP